MAKVAKNEAESVELALRNAHAQRMNKDADWVPGPQGERIDARPLIGMVYQMTNNAKMLGCPESLLLDPNPSSRYVWKVRKSAQTAAWRRAGILRPVSAAEIDHNNPMAEYTEVIEKTEAGEERLVTWESHGLFEMPAQWVDKFYKDPERWAIARLAQKSVSFADDIAGATGKQFEGTLKISQ